MKVATAFLRRNPTWRCPLDTPRLAILTAALAMLSGQLFGAESQTTDKPGFHTDFEAAKALAVRTGRPLLIHFYADYCPPCRRMEAEVFPDADLHRQLGEMVIAVKVNTQYRQDLAQAYGVDRIPHDRVVSPDGSELISGGGFMSKAAYLGMVRNASKKFTAMQPKVAKPATPPAAAARPKTAPALVNLDGYCPVELSLNRKWIKGDKQFVVEHKGLAYRISSKANYDRFKSQPEKYAPQVLGCDPVVLAASQKAIPGKTDFGAFFDGKLYLFQSKASRTTFKQNPLKYVRIQHALDASKIERTVVR